MCIFRETCQFRHPEAERNGSDRLRQRCGTWARYRIYNEGRAGALRRWLVDIFGADFLRSGSGILDVAGGKGELSFELNNLSGIRSTVVDPRPLEIDRYRKKLQCGFYHNNQVLSVYNVIPAPDSFDKHIVPPHLRMFFEVEGEAEPSAVMLPHALRTDTAFVEETRRAINTAWTNKGLIHEDDSSEEEGEMETPDAKECGSVILDYGVASAVVANCSMVVGMHPDQVSEGSTA